MSEGLKSLNPVHSNVYGMLGIHQHRISCMIGVYPQERQSLQHIIVDMKIKVDLSDCLASGLLKDTIDYTVLAQICTELAQKNNYQLIECLASDILDACLHRFQAVWAWVCIQKPAAIPSAAYAFVELERSHSLKEFVHVDASDRRG